MLGFRGVSRSEPENDQRADTRLAKFEMNQRSVREAVGCGVGKGLDLPRAIRLHRVAH